MIGLTEAPFGLFQSYAPMAMVAFAMRKYINVIFDTNGKQRTAQHLVDDVVELFKAWESGKTSNKLNFMFESKEAGRVCKNLIKMFSLNKLKGYSDISSLKDARWAVQNDYCKEKGYPLWSLKYVDDCSDQMKELIDNLVRVVTDPESMKNPNLLEATMNGYDSLKTDFGNLLLPQEDNFRKGFITYLNSIEIVNIQDGEIDDAKAYLQGHLQSEVGSWTEEEVKDKLKDWRMSLQVKTDNTSGQGGENQNQSNNAGYTGYNGGSSWSNGQGGNWKPINKDELKQKRDAALDKIAGNPNLQQALENLVNSEDGYIIDIILKYV